MIKRVVDGLIASKFGNGCRATSKRIRILYLIVFTIMSLGGALALWPIQGSPTITRDAWLDPRGFYEDVGPLNDVETFMRSSPQSRFWRSYSPQTGVGPGHIETAEFSVPRYLSVPYFNTPNRNGTSLNLVCVKSGKQIGLGSGFTNTNWGVATIRIPDDWCPDMAKIVADTTSSVYVLGVGTPFAVTAIAWLRISLFPTIFLHTFAFLTLTIWYLAFSHDVYRRRSAVGATTRGAIALGFAGLGSFFIFWASQPLGLIITTGCIALSSYIVARQAILHGISAWRSEIRDGIAAWYVVTLLYTLLTYSVDNGAGSWLVNTRFWPVEWSSDNQLPKIIADSLFSGHSLADGLLGGNWQVSDRPPLIYGLLTVTRMAAAPLRYAGLSGPSIAILYDMAGAIANGIWVPVLVSGTCLINQRRFGWACPVSIVGLLPFTIFNTVFIWPKMIGAAFGLLSLFVLLKSAASKTTDSQLRHAAIAAGLLFGLAFMSQGGTAFSLLTVAMWFGLFHWRLALVMAPFAGIAAIGTILPWTLWQKLVDPPGNALLKLALANTYGFDQPQVGLLATIITTYQHMSLNDILATRLSALRTMLGFETSSCGSATMQNIAAPFSQSSTPLLSAAHRVWDFLYEVPSLGIWWCGLLPLLASTIRRINPDVTLLSWRLICLGSLTLALTGLTTMGCYVIHHQSYEAMLSIAFGLSLAIAAAPSIFRIGALCVCALYTATVWVVDPLFLPNQVIWSNLGGFIVIALIIAAFLLMNERQSYSDGTSVKKLQLL